jgi:cobalt-precorrin-5B (C1)-methyltransferase
MTKLAQGLTDLHSRRGAVDLVSLAGFAASAGGSAALSARIKTANTAAEAFGFAQAEAVALGDAVARAAQATAARLVAGCNIAIEIAVFDREQRLVGCAPFAGG